MKKVNYVIDTNILLVSISPKSKYHYIFQAIVNGQINVHITNDILTEYEEIISNKLSTDVAKSVVRTLLLLNNVFLTDVFYKWDLITADRDDNKFVDCYIAYGADYIVTEDKHFSALKDIPFPQINVISLLEFNTKINSSLGGYTP